MSVSTLSTGAITPIIPGSYTPISDTASSAWPAWPAVSSRRTTSPTRIARWIAMPPPARSRSSRARLHARRPRRHGIARLRPSHSGYLAPDWTASRPSSRRATCAALGDRFGAVPIGLKLRHSNPPDPPEANWRWVPVPRPGTGSLAVRVPSRPYRWGPAVVRAPVESPQPCPSRNDPTLPRRSPHPPPRLQRAFQPPSPILFRETIRCSVLDVMLTPTPKDFAARTAASAPSR